MKINDVNFGFQSFNYNKSEVQADGVTHIINTDKEYTGYQLEVSKCYMDGTKQEVVKQAIDDLKGIITYLEQVLEQDKSKQEDREI